MKIGSKGVNVKKKKQQHFVLQFLSEMWFLLTNWKFIAPFLINISGSVLYYYTLGKSDISFVVPVANSITFLITAVVSMWMGEKTNYNTFIGMALVLLGVSICVQSQLES